MGGPADLVLSDMAANTTGHARTDQIKTGALAESAADFALAHLAPGGAFVTKAFQGGLDSSLLTRLKASFAQVRHAKPPASRSESSEIYLVAQGFRAPG
jgi:23S rRNA (uridine2552-2'-O)-methyltransferase